MPVNKLSNIVVHCSDSTWGSAAEIRRWHLAKGWKDGGYHFVIENGQVKPDLYLASIDGDVSVLRELDGDLFVEDNEIGAHALGYNDKSIGVCMIGKTTFSAPQMGGLIINLHEMRKRFKIEIPAIVGHYETEQSGGKTCPNIDMMHVRYLLGKIT